MKSIPSWMTVLALLSASLVPLSAPAQTARSSSATDSGSADDYPDRAVGFLIQSPGDWIPLVGVSPSKTRVKNGLAASFTYGAVKGVIEADYSGDHAAVQVAPARAGICICHIVSLPGDPLLVKLHPQKGLRMLDGGRLGILQAKMAEANKSDVIRVAISQPEDHIWIIRPDDPLPPGEYALMLGAQNMYIYPFTVTGEAAASSSQKH